jgi:hypothetical protein
VVSRPRQSFTRSQRRAIHAQQMMMLWIDPQV